ncbi:MarR family winged helix-turn-helix transcriptional regulator [Polymorphum gilvum]|uniref:Transcriptional regulator, MarR family n=1 Tax=Polymorphum gilvum (strain LMG 25793 / CGMCC 1.9160 / SL003B-26A1) TaxID=991905 RepID=F2J4H0_POLGS|nr:MarR family transcriptional regulator [Polymorphum gilvum]ADZ72223.1 Transcriptional regulator, MarR family [Polymorphum gilvum SL003B-26A1]
MKKPVVTNDALAHGLSNRLAFRLYQCANLLNKTGTRALERHDVTTQQWAILGALVRDRWVNGIAVRDLAALLMVSRQNLTGVLSRLESRGLVERVVDENDNRSRLIRLTKAGWQRWADMQEDIAGFYADAMRDLSTNDMIHALHYLDRLRQNLRAVDEAQGGED